MSTSFVLYFDTGIRAGERIPFNGSVMELGRSSQNDITLADVQLSRNHCRLELRGSTLWITDLDSANATFVNGREITSLPLSAGDRVSVGESSFVIEVAEAAPVHAETAAPVIDLGFENTSETEEPQKKNLIRPIIWSAGAILILVIGATLILDPGSATTKKTVVAKAVATDDRTPMIYYEKVEATAENVFRYELTLSANGMLAVKIDDLSGKNRHIRKEKKVDPALLGELAGEIEKSGFFGLEKSYAGFAASPNILNELTLTAAVGRKAHTCRITNRTEPEDFKVLRERLETFSKNELGIWAIQFSAEKLTELAQNQLEFAKKKFAERDVKYGNTFEAIQAYREAIFYLDTINPKPDFYADLLDGFDVSSKELETRYGEQSFRADRAINLSDWATAARELKILREMIPDRADERNVTASRKLVDVETRLKKGK